MKTHIFIATTQGLVAIQNITPIDDEDISSVVSINGTSTTANISGSYHNFVKKGVGIIHQIFGACSYRVDISARIDQGNSWQVAMYLAHLTQSKGSLGNGNVSTGDTVICATGEVNTTNHQVLAVGEVDLKFKLAQAQLEQWSALGNKVLFLLPQANQNDITNSPYIMLVNHLEQAANALPSINEKPASGNIKENKNVSANLPYKSIFKNTTLLLVAFFVINLFQESPKKTLQTNSESTKISTSVTPTQIQLTAQLKQGNTCAQTASQSVTLSNRNFAGSTLSQLCELTLKTDKSTSHILLVARDAYTVFPLNKAQEIWQIPLPKNQSSSRHYFLVTMTQTITNAKIEELRLYRETMPTPNMLTELLLSKWLESNNLGFTIYTHKLVID